MMPVMRKMMADLMREKTFVFALLLQILLIVSVTVILGFTSLFFSPESLVNGDVDIGVLVDDDLIPYLETGANVVVFGNKEDGLQRFKAGKLDAFMCLSKETVPYMYELYLPESEIESSIVMAVLKDKLEIYEDDIRDELTGANAVPLSKISISGKRKKGSDYLFELLYGFLIPFILLVPIFLVGSLVIDVISQEIEQKTFHILLMSTSFKKIFSEIVFGSVIIAIAQDIIWLSLLTLKGLHIQNIFKILVYNSIFSIFLFLLCVFITVKLKTKTRSQLIYSIVIMVISVTPGLTALNPVNVISVYSVGLESVGVIVYVIFIFLILLLYYFISKRKTIEEIA